MRNDPPTPSERSDDHNAEREAYLDALLASVPRHHTLAMLAAVVAILALLVLA